ncbi:MAG: hypothetical protein NTX49_08355, partial [Chlamydiae bacterium]|nr:hypothetical protein [Chlamydiota bacterium]
MIPLPSGLLPKVSCCHSLPDFDSAKSVIELMTDRLVRTGLYFHWLKKTEGIDPSRISTEMFSAVNKIMTVFKQRDGRPSSSDSSASTEVYKKVARFLLNLEEGSFSSEKLAQKFLSLDRESLDFLVQHVGTSLHLSQEQALGTIQQAPHLLLQIQNEKNENILEVLLKRLEERDSILDELTRIKSLPIPDRESLMNLLYKSPCFSLFCWYVWHNEGGKGNPNFGHLTYGEDRLNEDPSLLFKGDSSLLETMSSLQRKDEIFSLKATESRDNQSVMVELAKLCAQQNGYGTAEFIHIFGIDPSNQAALIEVAKLCAQQGARGIASRIQNFKIDPSNQAALIEIAKLCAQQDGLYTAEYIQEFGIVPSNQAALIELAKLCAQQGDRGVASRIQNFKIDPSNQEALIEIAKLCAQQDGLYTAESIQEFGIVPSNQAALIELAKLCAQQSGYGTANRIQKFRIDPSNQVALIEISKLCAQQNGKGTAEYIQNFGIDPSNQAALIEIAKLCA